MTEVQTMWTAVIAFGGLCGAIAAIKTVILPAVKRYRKPQENEADINTLKEQHSADIESIRQQHTKDIEAIKHQHANDNNEILHALSATQTKINDELCVMSWALLATLDGLKQKGCNGNVTKAHEALEKHLNKKAHGQV